MKLASDATQVTAKINVRVMNSNVRQDKSIVLKNTFCMPSIGTNLFLVAKLVDKEYTVLFTEKYAYVNDRYGNTKFVTNREGDLFFVREVPNATCFVRNESEDASEWHKDWAT